jgi:hypothetical protein
VSGQLSFLCRVGYTSVKAFGEHLKVLEWELLMKSSNCTARDASNRTNRGFTLGRESG